VRHFARPAVKRFKAVALHLCDWPWAVKLHSIATHGVPEKIAQKAGTTVRGWRPGSLFSKLVQVQVVASDFLHTQHDLKRRSNEVQVEYSMQQVSSKKRDHAIWNLQGGFREDTAICFPFLGARCFRPRDLICLIHQGASGGSICLERAYRLAAQVQ
jgi:hypothetical protein